MMVIIAALLVITIGVAIFFSIKRPKDFTFKLWGTVTMFVFAPLLTFLVGTLYGISEGSGFAGAAVFMVMAPILFVVGIILFVMGMKYT